MPDNYTVLNLEEMKARIKCDGHGAFVLAETWVDEHENTITMANVCSGIEMQSKVPAGPVLLRFDRLRSCYKPPFAICLFLSKRRSIGDQVGEVEECICLV